MLKDSSFVQNREMIRQNFSHMGLMKTNIDIFCYMNSSPCRDNELKVLRMLRTSRGVCMVADAERETLRTMWLTACLSVKGRGGVTSGGPRIEALFLLFHYY